MMVPVIYGSGLSEVKEVMSTLPASLFVFKAACLYFIAAANTQHG